MNACLWFALATVLCPVSLSAAEDAGSAGKSVATPADKPRPQFQYKSDGIEVPAATADEPRVKAFGPETIQAAAKYLDDGAHHWVREKSCIACHSTGVYMVERSALTAQLGKPSAEILKNFTEAVPEEGTSDETQI